MVQTQVKTDWNEDRDWTEVQWEIVRVTPEIARRMMAHNTNNRPFRPWRAEQFVKKLQDHEFYNTGQGVLFFTDGTLADRQHTLSAIWRSGIPAEIDVRYGVPLEARHAIDIPLRRRPGDVLAQLDQNDVNTLASGLKLVWRYLHDNGGRAVHFDDHTVYLQLLTQHGDIREHLTTARIVGKTVRIPPAAAAAGGYLSGESPIMGDSDWLLGLIDPAYRYPDDPRTALERQISRARDKKNRIDSMLCLALYGAAYRSYEAELGQTDKLGVRQLTWRRGAHLPIFGRVPELRATSSGISTELRNIVPDVPEEVH